jgi:tetratricopeptide (TPR) repeat protein
MAFGVILLVLPWGCEQERPRTPKRQRAPAAQPPQRKADMLAARERALLERLAENPQDLDARLALANLYYDTDRPHGAVAAYIEVLKHRPDEPNIRTDLGTCYKRMGIPDKARAEYERVLAKRPEHVNATYNLAVVSDLAGERLRAAELWERAAALAPGTPLARNALKHAAACRAAAEPTTKTPTSPTGEESPQ